MRQETWLDFGRSHGPFMLIFERCELGVWPAKMPSLLVAHSVDLLICVSLDLLYSLTLHCSIYSDKVLGLSPFFWF
jgi:hypothetical protein